MHTIMTAEETIRTGGRDITVSYELLEHSEGGESRYGVSAENQNTGERAEIGDITSVRARAEQFFNLLIVGQVTPVTLRDAAEDFVADF